MNKLILLSLALRRLGHQKESASIQKLAREYVSRVATEGLSRQFYQTVRAIENEVYEWRPEVISHLISEAGTRNPNVTIRIIHRVVRECLNDWTSSYAGSIGSTDSSIPPWLFSFLEEKIFPFLKESFSKEIEALPADSQTKSGLQTWLSQTTLKQLGVKNLADTLDAGAELWTTFLSNAIHEIHHNILNHSAWHRFSTYGEDPSKYNFLDAMEEGFAASIKPISRIQDEERMWKEFSTVMSDFLMPMIKDLFKERKSFHPGEALYQDWNLVYQNLDNIQVEDLGIKLPEEKRSFLRKVFNTLYQDSLANREYKKIHTWDNFRNLLAAAIKKVWSDSSSTGSVRQWDFLTGDDETLLINLMKDLDSRADELWSLWEDHKAKFYQLSNQKTASCIDAKIKEYQEYGQKSL